VETWITSGSRNFLKDFYVYYCDRGGQPGVKHENGRRWRFELCECNLLVHYCCYKTHDVTITLLKSFATH